MRVVVFLMAASMALLWVAAPASASHVSCGDTITVDTKLDSDVVCGPGESTGVTIGASDVILHLGGHTIRGEGTYGVRAGSGLVQLDGLEIRGGSIDGFFFGVDASADNSLAAGLTVTGARAGIYMRGDNDRVLLSDVTIAFTSLEAGGIVAFGDNSHITRNIVRGVGAYGIRTSSGMIGTTANNHRIAVNTVECDPEVGTIGIDATYQSFAVIAQNEVTRCTIGVAARAGDSAPGGGQVRRNTANENGTGIDVHDPAALVWRNTASLNLDAGVTIDLPGVTVQENAANDNGTFGINAPTGTVDGGGNTASGNGTADCVNVSCGP